MAATINSKVPCTKALSIEGQDRSKDILRAIFIHRELWTPNGYPRSINTIKSKWNLLLDHPLLIDYLENNQGKTLT